ncbi:MAG: hypothetical protein R2873_36275 [Caldilineaceae bacterium]
MIRPLEEADRPGAVTLLRRDAALNLYPLGNMASLGFDSEICQFWGDFGADGRVRGVLNRYMTGWVIYGLPDADWPALAAVIDDHPLLAERLQDNPGGVDSILPYLRRYRAQRIEAETLMALDEADFRAQPPSQDAVVRRAAEGDLADLLVFYADAGDMTRSETGCGVHWKMGASGSPKWMGSSRPRR